MKKIIFSLGALFAVSIASAQSYPKQPDKTIVKYESHQKAAVAEQKTEATAEPAAVKPAQTQPATKDEKAQKAKIAVVPNDKTSVAVTETKE